MKTKNTKEKKTLKQIYFDFMINEGSKITDVNEFNSEIVILFDFDIHDYNSNRGIDKDGYLPIRRIMEFFIIDNGQDYIFDYTLHNKDDDPILFKKKEIALNISQFELNRHRSEEPYKSHQNDYYYGIITNGKYCEIDLIHKSLEPFDPEYPDTKRTYYKYSELADDFYHYEEPTNEETNEDSTQ